MARLRSFQPFWSDTVIFWGAGATASLGIKTTEQLAHTILRLAQINENRQSRIEERVKEEFPNVGKQVQAELAALFVLLGEEGDRRKAIRALGFSEERVSELKRLYDWTVTREVMKRCPGIYDGRFLLQDYYNLIDLHIKSGQGFAVNGRFIRPEELITARRTLNMLIGIIHAMDFQVMLTQKKRK
ncbi:hypothetical protein [Anoxybacillus sp. J5B_2022]|uniref:hypothetical protein n=1 Tax=Anoxybacillus sp. J5B_2022 TaxID=3003246 RepID=UPI0022863F7B|nr:hypothetical protein [Anoxybacillus sp. J5B_2022]MCZ0757116.1 hypothetical protein [Anoxybacillus sp. J5B_2022]